MGGLVPVKCWAMKLYRVKLTPEERAQLLKLLSKGKAAARTLTHARILLKADEGVAGPQLSDEAISEALEVNRSTVERVRIRCVEDGFETALRPRPSRTWSRSRAVRRRTAEDVGRYVSWPTNWWNWKLSTPSRMRRCARH
jgi:hypothetical protein